MHAADHGKTRRYWPAPRQATGAAMRPSGVNGPRFASVKIDPVNLERVLSNRDGAFIVNRIRGALGYRPI